MRTLLSWHSNANLCIVSFTTYNITLATSKSLLDKLHSTFPLRRYGSFSHFKPCLLKPFASVMLTIPTPHAVNALSCVCVCVWYEMLQTVFHFVVVPRQISEQNF